MKLSLKFDKNLEKKFQKDYNEKSVGTIRLGLVISMVLYGLFGILDYWIVPFSRMTTWLIRFAIVIPVTFAALVLTYFKSFKKYAQLIMAVIGTIAGLGIVVMIAVSKEYEAGFHYYYAGLMLIIMGIFTLLRLRFIYTVISSLTIVTAYEFTAIVVQKLLSGGIENPYFYIFLNNNFFFIGAFIIGITAAYLIEMYIRNDFLKNETILSKQNSMEILLSNIRGQMELARHIQEQMLPGRHPEIENAECAVFYKSMEELGGDFYEFIDFQEPNLTGILICDVSGHGVPAALITGMVKALCSTSGNKKFFPPEFLQYINSRITGQINDNFITALYAVYDSNTMTLEFSRAGHTYPLLIRNNVIQEIKAPGMPLGILRDAQYEEFFLQLEPGDRVLLYTDGLTESENISGIPFENILFNKILPDISTLPLKNFIDAIYESTVSHRGSEKFDDDICIIAIEVSPSSTS